MSTQTIGAFAFTKQWYDTATWQSNWFFGPGAAASGSAATLNTNYHNTPYVYCILKGFNPGTQYTVSFSYRQNSSYTNSVEWFKVIAYDGTTETTVFSTVPSSSTYTSTSGTFTASSTKMMIILAASDSSTTSNTQTDVNAVTVGSLNAAVYGYSDISPPSWCYGFLEKIYSGSIRYGPYLWDYWSWGSGAGTAAGSTFCGFLDTSKATVTSFMFTNLIGMEIGTEYGFSVTLQRGSSYTNTPVISLIMWDGTTSTTVASVTRSSSNTTWYKLKGTFTPTTSKYMFIITSTYADKTDTVIGHISCTHFDKVSQEIRVIDPPSWMYTSLTNGDNLEATAFNTTNITSTYLYSDPRPNNQWPTSNYSASVARFNLTSSQSASMYSWLEGLDTSTSYTLNFCYAYYDKSPTSFTVVVDDNGTSTTIYSGVPTSSSYVKISCTSFTPTRSFVKITVTATASSTMYIYVTDFNITPGWDFLQPICFNPTDPSTSSLIADFDYIANCNINTFTAGKESRFGNWFFSENAGIQNSSSYGSVAAVSGSYAALLNATSGTETFIYTILHNMDTGTSYTITFYDRKYTSHNAVDTFEVKIYDGTSWTTIYSTVSSSNSFTQRTCTSFTPSQSTMLLLFVATNTGTYSEERVFLDSIAISPKGTVWNSSYKTSTLKYPTSSVTHIGRFNYPFMNSTSTSLDHAWCENWFFSEQSGIVAASSYGSITPPTGSYSAMLYAKYNTSGYMYTILKGLTTTTSYTITFYNRQYSNPMFDSFTVKVFDSTGTTTTIYSSTAYSTAFVKRTCTAFTPTSSTMGLVFEGKNTGTNQTTAVFIDCVDITYDSNIYLTNSGLTNPVEGSFTTIGNFYGAGAITSTGGSYLGWYLGSNMYISNSVTASPSWSSALRFAPPSAGTTVYAYTVLSGLDTSTAYTVSYYTGKYSSSDTINSSTYSFYVNIYDGTTATRISSATPTSIAFTKQTCDSFVPTASTMMLVFASKDTNAKNTYVGLVKIDKASVSFYSSGITYSSTAISTSSATTNSSLNAPSSLAGSASDGAVSLTWSAPTSGETPSSYTIQVVGSSTFYVSGITGTSKTISGLTNDTTYAFSIKSVNANGSSSYSSSISKTPTSGTVPGAPTSLNCTLGDGSVSLSWSAPSDNGGSTITSYTVTYSDGTTTSTITGLTVLYASVSGLTNGTTYTFYVQAINAIGTGTASSSVSLTVVSYTDLVSAITTSATSVSSTTASTTSSMIVYVQSSDDLSNADANTIQTAVTTYATNATALDNYLSELSAANKALKTAISNAVDSLT